MEECNFTVMVDMIVMSKYLLKMRILVIWLGKMVCDTEDVEL